MRTISIWLLLGALACGQAFTAPVPDNGVSVAQVTFLIADKAELATDGSRIAILAEGLDAKREFGAIVTLKDAAKWIEVHPVANPFPPRVERPYKDHTFLIRGQPGEKFYVSIRSDDDGPTWIEVAIAGEPAPDPEKPPPVDPNPPPAGSLAELSRSLSQAMGDPETASAIKASLGSAVSSLEALCRSGQCPTIAVARAQVIYAIESALRDRKKPNKDWLKGWRDPVSKAVGAKNPADAKTYVALMRAVTEGL
jgi:hypothetical protein